MDMSEYRKRYPQLCKDTFEIINENRDVLKQVRRESRRKRTTIGKDVTLRTDLQTRIKLAVTDRYMPDGESWIPVLYPDVKNPNKTDRYGHPMGAGLDETTESQRNAFYLQQEILISCVWEDDQYYNMTDEDWEHALGSSVK